MGIKTLKYLVETYMSNHSESSGNLEIQKRWENFCKKILKYELNFADVVNIIIDFISPPYNAMIQENELLKVWDSKKRKYL